MEAPLAEAHSYFSRFPQEVFRLWLDDRVRGNGWPPQGIEWEGFLCGKSPSYWQQLNWRFSRVALDLHRFSRPSLDTVLEMFKANIAGEHNLLSAYIPNTRERFYSLVEYIKKHQAIPEPLVLLECDSSVHVVEGNHRVAAMLALGSSANALAFLPREVDAWVAYADA